MKREINLAELERLAKAATPGPWLVDWYDETGAWLRPLNSPVPGFSAERIVLAQYLAAADGDFCAAASPDVVLRLVAALRLLNDGPSDYLAKHGIADEGAPMITPDTGVPDRAASMWRIWLCWIVGHDYVHDCVHLNLNYQHCGRCGCGFVGPII